MIMKNKDIKRELKMADKKTNQMRRRNICMKCILWLIMILLLGANGGLIAWKLI